VNFTADSGADGFVGALGDGFFSGFVDGDVAAGVLAGGGTGSDDRSGDADGSLVMGPSLHRDAHGELKRGGILALPIWSREAGDAERTFAWTRPDEHRTIESWRSWWLRSR
jgi:hypothetical protein